MGTKAPKRSPHKAVLTRNAANVLATNLRTILIERHGIDAATFGHQQAHALVADAAGYKNSQQLAASYAPEPLPALATEQDRSVGSQPHNPAERFLEANGIPFDAPDLPTWIEFLKRSVAEATWFLVTTPEDMRSLIHSVPGADAVEAHYLLRRICISNVIHWVEEPTLEEVLIPASMRDLASHIGEHRFLIFDPAAFQLLNGRLRAEGCPTPSPESVEFIAHWATEAGETETQNMFDLGYQGAACRNHLTEMPASLPLFTMSWASEIMTCILGVEHQKRLFNAHAAKFDRVQANSMRAGHAHMGKGPHVVDLIFQQIERGT